MVQMTFVKDTKAIQCSRTVSSTNRHWENKISHVKEQEVDMYIHHIYKLTQNGLNT